jgi:hypothetical protein
MEATYALLVVVQTASVLKRALKNLCDEMKKTPAKVGDLTGAL